MKELVLGLILLAGIATTPAYSKPYVSGSVGLGILGDWDEAGYHKKFDRATAWNGAVGYRFGSSMRLEGALGYESHNYKSPSGDDLSLLTVMANGYYDIDLGSAYTPYLMVGAGVADVDVSWSADSMTSFVWQVGAGMGFKVNDNFTFDLGYRYIKPEGLECPYEGNDVNLHSQHIMAGIRYQF